MEQDSDPSGGEEDEGNFEEMEEVILPSGGYEITQPASIWFHEESIVSDEAVPQEWDRCAEVSDDEPVTQSPLRDDAAVTVSLHRGVW